MSIPGSAEPLLLAQQDTGYRVERSLRFNSSDSAYLSRTPASAGNRKTWTWAGWVKRSALGVRQNIFGTADASANNALWIEFFNTDALRVVDYTTSIQFEVITTQVFRDVSAWAHLVVSVDTTQGTASNRVKMYWNGLEITQFSTATYPGASVDTQLNTATAHGIGRAGSYNAQYFSGYLADIHFIDGQALDPTSFTEVSATTGQLIPIAYTGSYGTNGFHLPFSDNSTSAALGTDTSGNSNTWTVNNISVTAGAGNDSLVDTPTSYGTDTGAGGEVRGNYATFSPITTSGQGLATLANGNHDISGTGSNYTGCVSTIAVSSGKWYWEYTVTAYGSASGTGLVSSSSLSGAVGGSYGYAQVSDGWFRSSTTVANNASNAVTGLSSIGTNDVINVAVDIDAGKLWFGRNGTWESSGNPASGTNAPVTFTPGGKSFYALAQGYGTWSGVLNAGARSFAYTAPSGFKALCDTSLPAPVVAKPNTVFDTKLYTGNGSTQNITGLGFSPDLVWIKTRSIGYYNVLYDTVRGTGTGKALYSNTTDAEGADATLQNLTAFNSDGFSLGTTSGTNILNDSSQTRVAWTWDAGSSTVTNTQGSISSQVRANASAGFSIVTYSFGNAPTVGHGLGVAPSLIIAKSRTVGTDWVVYHRSLGKDQPLVLNDTGAALSISNYWGTSEPSSTVFGTIGNNTNSNNRGDMVAYCFAPVAGYSSFGSYTGNGSTDGPFVFTGMRPRWILLKSSSTTGDWVILDAVRDSANAVANFLRPNLSDAEGNAGGLVDFCSNGFKLRNTFSNYNTNGTTYIYFAVAESPFQYARAR